MRRRSDTGDTVLHQACRIRDCLLVHRFLGLNAKTGIKNVIVLIDLLVVFSVLYKSDFSII